MKIDKSLFDECWSPCNGIARVCLRGDREIPTELEKIGKEKDNTSHAPGCFNIDIAIKDSIPTCGVINYEGEVETVICDVCNNFVEAWEYFKKHADKEDYADAIATIDKTDKIAFDKMLNCARKRVAKAS